MTRELLLGVGDLWDIERLLWTQIVSAIQGLGGLLVWLGSLLTEKISKLMEEDLRLLWLNRRNICWTRLTNRTRKLLPQLIQRTDARKDLATWSACLAKDWGDVLECIYHL